MECVKDRQGGVSSQAASISQAEIDEMDNKALLEAYQTTGDPGLKWALVLRFTGMVRRVASQVCGLYNSFAEPDDIINEGILVLLNAVDKFDPTKDTKFETYVSKRLRGMVIDLARNQDWLPRQVRQKTARLNRATEELAMELGRMPTSREMAEHMGITMEEYASALAETTASGLISFEALLDAGGGGGGRSLTGSGQEELPEEHCEEQELHEILRKGVASLREKEQMVLSLYYEKGLNMREIAQVLNVSAPRVSQIHSRAIQHLRLYMKQYLEA